VSGKNERSECEPESRLMGDPYLFPDLSGYGKPAPENELAEQSRPDKGGEKS